MKTVSKNLGRKGIWDDFLTTILWIAAFIIVAGGIYFILKRFLDW